jgi:N-methylhydantoinase A
VTEVIFPADASTFSAYGILQSDIVHDIARSRIVRAIPENLPEIVSACIALREQGRALVAQDGLSDETVSESLSADMRYHGQAFELVVPWGDVSPDEATLPTLIASFHALHRSRFSYANETDPVEIVTLRLTVTGRLPRADGEQIAERREIAASRSRPVFLGGAWRDVPVHARAGLRGPILGPALIEEEYTTVFIADGWRCAPGPNAALIANRITP